MEWIGIPALTCYESIYYEVGDSVRDALELSFCSVEAIADLFRKKSLYTIAV